MADEWTSDFEKLLAKCAVDQDFRARLTTALAANDDSGVSALLTNLGIAGKNIAARNERVSALKSALGPFTAVIGQFTDSGHGELAP